VCGYCLESKPWKQSKGPNQRKLHHSLRNRSKETGRGVHPYTKELVTVSLCGWNKEMSFGSGKDFHFILAHEKCASLGSRRSTALPIFHAFTGCDTVSHFAQIGKNTASKVWETQQELTDAFYGLHNAPEEISEEVESSLECFTILLCDRTATCSSINECRKILFTHKGCEMLVLPPTKAALKQHIKGSFNYRGQSPFLKFPY